MIKSIQTNSNALKKNIVNIPNRIIKIPPRICHLKVMQANIKSIIQGNEFGILCSAPEFSDPDIKEKTIKQIEQMTRIIFKIFEKFILCGFKYIKKNRTGDILLSISFCSIMSLTQHLTVFY